jgi:hypothetical protein
MDNPSKAKVKRCFLCGSVYEENYGTPFSEKWICADCLSTIPLKQLHKYLMKKREGDSYG